MLDYVNMAFLTVSYEPVGKTFFVNSNDPWADYQDTAFPSGSGCIN
jgi:hypothetical protein